MSKTSKPIRKRPRSSSRPDVRYLATPIPGLFLYPTVLLLNLIVSNADDNAKTDGIIPLETVDVVTALIRNRYDFPDLDLAQGKGVLISLIGQFFHPDDYEEHAVGEVHIQSLFDVLQGDLAPRPLDLPELRTSTVADPGTLAQGREKTLAFWYKQRFLSACFVGERAQLDKLRGDIPIELLNQILGAIWEGVGISKDAYVTPQPSFVPVSRLRKVSQQNAVEWADQMRKLMDDIAARGKEAALTVVGPPGPTYTVRPRKRKR